MPIDIGTTLIYDDTCFIWPKKKLSNPLYVEDLIVATMTGKFVFVANQPNVNNYRCDKLDPLSSTLTDSFHLSSNDKAKQSKAGLKNLAFNGLIYL